MRPRLQGLETLCLRGLEADFIRVYSSPMTCSQLTLDLEIATTSTTASEVASNNLHHHPIGCTTTLNAAIDHALAPPFKHCSPLDTQFLYHKAIYRVWH